MIKIHLDPRTKLFMIFAVSFIVMANAVSPTEWAVRIIVTLIPVFLLANEGRYVSALRFLLCCGAALFLLRFYISAESTGVLSALLAGYCGIIAQFMPAMIMAWYVMHTTKIGEFMSAMQKMHVPDGISVSLAVVMRFFPTIKEEYLSINDAMKMRGISFSGGRITKMIAYRLVPLMFSCLNIGEELSAAAVTRGLGAPVRRTSPVQLKLQAADLLMLASVVGTVFQNPRSQFFAIDTDGEITFGAENIGMPPEEIVSRKNAAANEMHIERLLDRSIFALSGGEKQIIACASVSVLSPDIMVLDEPSSNLDSAAAEKLKAILADWKSQGKTVIIAEHRLYFLRELADRMLLLESGRIVKELQADEIRALTFADTERMGIHPLSLSDAAYTRKSLSRQNEMFTLENFVFTYKDGRHGINIPRLELPMHSIIAIIGHNGAGKSTLARNICGLEKKCRGVMKLGGKTLKAKDRLKSCWLIMQDVNHQLFTESVLDEVMLSITDKQMTDTEKTQRSEEILAQLHLSAYRDAHPMALSGGQKQRTAIASGIASGKPVVIFDEPTSGPDLAHMKQAAGEILKLCDMGKTVFIVTHDLELILLCCDHIVRLEEGKAVENYGLNPDTVMKLQQFSLQMTSSPSPC